MLCSLTVMLLADHILQFASSVPICCMVSVIWMQLVQRLHADRSGVARRLPGLLQRLQPPQASSTLMTAKQHQRRLLLQPPHPACKVRHNTHAMHAELEVQQTAEEGLRSL